MISAKNYLKRLITNGFTLKKNSSFKKKGLGRGLDVLLGENVYSGENNLKVLPLENIKPGSTQPRRKFDKQALNELADSIKTQGLLQPIVVRETSSKKYEIIAGERRWRASKIAELTEIPAIIKEANDNTSLAIALVENMQRKDLNSVEEARGIEKLVRLHGLTHEKIARALGKSRTSITNLLRLLNSEPEVQQLLTEGYIEQGHVKTILSLSPSKQIEIANLIVASNLSVRETEKIVQEIEKNKKSADKKVTSLIDNDIKLLELELSDYLNLVVMLRMKTPSKGKIEINFSNLDELDSFLKKIELKK